MANLRWLPLALVALAGCRYQPPSDPPGSFAFAVFGDAPHTERERTLVERLIEDVNSDDLAFFVHVGDILEYPCSDSLLSARYVALQRIRVPVIYTPGDNEWTDCWRRRAGGYAPLERLARLRGVFFPDPSRSSGGRRIDLATQARDIAYAEFLENARWTYRGVVFATVHMVGSWNGTRDFPKRTVVEDREVVRRTAAAIVWVRAAFAAARSIDAHGVVIATHADPQFDLPPQKRQPFNAFLSVLEEESTSFGRPVLFIHGDTHRQRVDRPFERGTGAGAGPGTSASPPDFTRLETFGSPVVGWVRVVVDTAVPDLFRIQPRRVGR